VTGDAPTVGVFEKDHSEGKFIDELRAAVPAKFQLKDAADFFEALAGRKTATEQAQLEKSGRVTAFVLKKLISRIEDIINDEEKISHAQVADKMRQILEAEDSAELAKFSKQNSDVDTTQIELPLPIKIQSGGSYSFDLTDSSNSDEVKDDTITISAGAEYQVQTTAAVRTILINPDPE
jgi:nucleosome binding factor SPN SPT16 subunit